MIARRYRKQVELLLRVLPYVAEVKCFALKGGTAINLFHGEMPRLSVDIDLTYVSTEERTSALVGITEGLAAVRKAIVNSGMRVQVSLMPQTDGSESKLLCVSRDAQIKVEVNTTIRGCLQPVVNMPVARAVQDEFGMFAAINVVARGELYGGKICAALDRQHPRDLFDIEQMMVSGGITEDIRAGFVAMLAGHNRPAHEVLNPNLLDQRQVFESQFDGMSRVPFTYEDFEYTRERLVYSINSCLTDADRAFLMSLTAGEPDWKLYSVEGAENLSAIKWKLQNIRALKRNNAKKHAEICAALAEQLNVDNCVV